MADCGCIHQLTHPPERGLLYLAPLLLGCGPLLESHLRRGNLSRFARFFLSLAVLHLSWAWVRGLIVVPCLSSPLLYVVRDGQV